MIISQKNQNHYPHITLVAQTLVAKTLVTQNGDESIKEKHVRIGNEGNPL